MRILKREVCREPGSKLGKTVYTVSLGSCDVVLERNHYSGRIRVQGPLPAGISEQELVRFLKENGPKEDFALSVFERKYPYSFAAVRDTCYSVEQAFLLAEEAWERNVVRAGKTSAWFDSFRDLFRIFYYADGKKLVIKDWLK